MTSSTGVPQSGNQIVPYTLNKIGDNMPPCRTPLITLKIEDIKQFHPTHEYSLEYQFTITLRNI